MNSSHVSDADLLELELTRKRFAYSIGSLWSGTVGRSTIDPHWDFAEKSREAHRKFPVVEFVHSIRVGRRGGSDERRKPRVRPHRYGERTVDAPRAKTRTTRLPTNVTLPQRPTSTHAAKHSSSAYTIMAVSIFQRKRDFIYFVFFLVHLPVMLGEYREGISRLEALSRCNSVAVLHMRGPDLLNHLLYQSFRCFRI